MKWRMVCSTAAVLAFVGVAMSDTYTALITGVKDGKVTFYKAKFNKAEKKLEKEGDKITLPAEDAKVSKGKFDKDAKKFVAGDAIEGGIKAELFGKATEEKGIGATITTDTDDKKITEILLFGGKKGK
jgi:hypothetical protein